MHNIFINKCNHSLKKYSNCAILPKIHVNVQKEIIYKKKTHKRYKAG